MKVENNQQSQPNIQQQMDQMLKQPGQAQPVQPMQPMNGPAKKKKKCNVPALVLGVVAVLGVGAGAYFGVQYFGEKERADKLAQQNAAVATAEVAEAESGEMAEVAGATDTSEYIYIGEWGYKIKIPEGLKYVSYGYENGEEISAVGVAGVYNSTKLYDFADPTKTGRSDLGFVSRMQKGTCVKGEKFCTEENIVFTDDSYEYLYEHPQAVYSEIKAEQDIEVSSVDAIEKMLSNKDNYSKI